MAAIIRGRRAARKNQRTAIDPQFHRAFGEFHQARVRPNFCLAFEIGERRDSFGASFEGAKIRPRSATSTASASAPGTTSHRCQRRADCRRGSCPPSAVPPPTAAAAPACRPVRGASRPQRAQAWRRPAARQQRQRQKAQHCRRRRQIGGARHVALAPRLVQFARGGFVRAVGAVVLVAHGANTIGSANTPWNAPSQIASIRGAASANSTSPPSVSAGAPTKATISCGIARLIAPSARL